MNKSISKNVEKLAKKIESYYYAAGISISLHFLGFVASCQRLVYKVVIGPGERVDAILDRAKDVEAFLNGVFIELFKDGNGIFLVAYQHLGMNNSLVEMLNSSTFRRWEEGLPIALGYKPTMEMVFADLEMVFHALYIGSTGSGKSTGLMCLVLSLICRHPADKVNLLILDTCDVADGIFDPFEGIPHLSFPIVRDKDTGVYAIQMLFNEMERRNELNAREMESLPSLICIIDEYISFVDEVEGTQRQELVRCITGLLRRGRKVHIHVVLASQNPKDDAMKAETKNITARMVFRVDRYQTSVAAINCGGAEKLSGKGAMLYSSTEYIEPVHIQGAYISAEETKQLVECIRVQNHDFSRKFIIPETTVQNPSETRNLLAGETFIKDSTDQEICQIAIWVLGKKTVSVEKIKKQFRIGNRANCIMDRLCKFGIVSEKKANLPRQVLPQSIEKLQDEILDLFTHYGFSNETIIAAISERDDQATVQPTT